ncbi:MAG TPA: hypothetical protein VF369_03845 [candidate division Zixibacteria bacterium]
MAEAFSNKSPLLLDTVLEIDTPRTDYDSGDYLIAGVGFVVDSELAEGNQRPSRLWQFDFAHCPEFIEGNQRPSGFTFLTVE